MADNDFEKRVQQMMRQLKLQPSETVWQNVEGQINKKKRRRWLLLLLLPALGLGGYLLLPEKNTPTAGIPTTKNANINSKKNNEKNSTLYQPEKLNDSAVANHENEKENSPLIAEADVRPQQILQSFLKTRKEKEFVTNSEMKKEMIAKSEEQNETAALEKQNEEDQAGTSAQKILVADSLLIADNKNADNATIVVTNEQGNAEKMGDTVLAENDEQKKTNTQLSKKITVTQKPFQLQWGISAFIGRNDAVMSFFNHNSAQDKSYADYSAGIPDTISFNPYEFVKASAAFGLGGFVQKDISKRSSIRAGINFSYLRTKAEGVRRIDSTAVFQNESGYYSVFDYYRPTINNAVPGTGGKQTSANAYLFLEIPVTYHYKLTNSTKLPLYVNAGISANALLYKNALLFDQSNFVFYKGTNQYNNFQLHATFGFAAQLQLNKKYALQLGPQLKYGLTNISNDKKTYGRQHFLQYGLQANLLFSKK